MAAAKKTDAMRARAAEALERLRREYPDATCSLEFEKPLDLLVATILAAQCTDERVNIVTKSLFKKYRRAEDYVAAPAAEIEKAIHTCGFFRQKTKSIQGACKAILERHDGKVPGTMDELLALDGVGRKTANVLLGECFDVPGVIVDTHCKRVTSRLGLTRNEDPGKIEQDIMKLLPQRDWNIFSHCMVFHGRAICIARGPKCSECPVNDLCPFPRTAAGKKIAR